MLEKYNKYDLPQNIVRDIKDNINKYGKIKLVYENDIASIYKLSFSSIVTALDNGIQINEIIEYLQKYNEASLPENVLVTLKNWERESRQIRIRTVTIVEADNIYLLEELKSYKSIKNNILDELPFAFEIEGKSANKVKREIEKKNHFCIVE